MTQWDAVLSNKAFRDDFLYLSLVSFRAKTSKAEAEVS